MADDTDTSAEVNTQDIDRFREMIRILQEEGMVPSPHVNHNENSVPDVCPLNESQMETLQTFGTAMTEERINTLCNFLDTVTDLRQGSKRTLKWFVIGLILTGMSFFFLVGMGVKLKIL